MMMHVREFPGTEDQWKALAIQLRKEARSSRDKKEDSFERSDTDGFVTQHCHDLSAQLSIAQAEICDNMGRSMFRGLYKGTTRIKARQFTNAYGTSWLIKECDRHLTGGRAFIPVQKNSHSRSRIQKMLGLEEHLEWAPAWARLDGKGHGFSGLSSVHVLIYRRGDEWGSDAICELAQVA